MNFAQKLHQATQKNRSLVCIGLDPEPELMPKIGIFEFNKAIIEATSDLVCAYKPNLAFYEAPRSFAGHRRAHCPAKDRGAHS